MTDSDPRPTTVEDSAALLKKARHEARIDFWFSSVARGTLLVYATSFVTLIIWLTYSNKVGPHGAVAGAI